MHAGQQLMLPDDIIVWAPFEAHTEMWSQFTQWPAHLFGTKLTQWTPPGEL